MTTDEQTIRNLVARWHRATADGDVYTVFGLVSEDVVFLVCGNSPMKGRNTLEKGLRGGKQPNGSWQLVRDANLLSPAA